MLNSVRVTSFSPGRVRLKVPDLRTSKVLANQIHDRITVLPGINKIDINPATGSVLLQYEKHLFADPAAVDALQQALDEQLSPLERAGLGRLVQSQAMMDSVRQVLSSYLSTQELNRLQTMLTALATKQPS